jgi:hypothetical protein
MLTVIRQSTERRFDLSQVKDIHCYLYKSLEPTERN